MLKPIVAACLSLSVYLQVASPLLVEAALLVPYRYPILSRNSRVAAAVFYNAGRISLRNSKGLDVNTTQSLPCEQTPPSREPMQTTIRNSFGTEKEQQPGEFGSTQLSLSGHPAMKPLETTAKSQLGFGVANHITENFVAFAEQFVGRAGTGVTERTVEHSSKRAVEGIGGKALSRATRKGGSKVVSGTSRKYGPLVAGRSGERFLERFGETSKNQAFKRTFDSVGETVSTNAVRRSLSKTSEKASERMGRRFLGRAGRKGGTAAAKRAAVSAGERVLDKASRKGLAGAVSKIYKGTGKRMLEQAAKKRGPKLASRAAGRAGKRALTGVGTRVVEKAKMRSGMKAAARTSERIGERALQGVGDRFLDQASRTMEAPGTAVGHTGKQLVERHSKKAVARLSKGLIIALPVLGGLFALHMLKSDIERIREEWSDRAKLSLGSFALAGLADFVDSLVHFWMAYALFKQMVRSKLVAAEHVSMVCAVVSTSCAVLGEFLSFRRSRLASSPS